MRKLVLGISIVLSLWTRASLYAQDLDPADVHVPLDSALHIAQKAAASAFPELTDYLLYSAKPRVLLGDPGGLHWEVLWQERAFPHHRWLVVRVYMSDGHTAAEREPAGAGPSPTSAPPQ